LLRSKVILEFHAFAAVKKLFKFWGAIMTPKLFLGNLDSPKRYYLEKTCLSEAL
jgi:hypothetical protein